MAERTASVAEVERSQNRTPIQKTCSLWVHPEAFSRQPVLFNASMIHGLSFEPGTLLKITPLDAAVGVRDFQDIPRVPSNTALSVINSNEHEYSRDSTSKRRSSEDKADYRAMQARRSFVFIAKDMTPEEKQSFPHLQISLSEEIANLFGFRSRAPVLLTTADEALHTASHVEIAYRDVYLARGDLWRLTISELSNKTIYEGQKILHLGTIKAAIKSIYVNGKIVPSAIFSENTRPIFRSDSARFILYIQMSKEMWDFDSDSGDINFNKVITGFLPDLFKRWVRLKARHLVSIILFTRMSYEHENLEQEYTSNYRSDGDLGSTKAQSTKDFYRVVVSEMSSGDWTQILYKLKTEFKTFLRDISIDLGLQGEATTNTSDRSNNSKNLISGQPTPAMHGNVLEAINLASSQFSGDYIDRDLIRTGLSVVVITPGTGVFEVDEDLLKLTTEVLVTNGIGLDLVCLSQIPLHSVPLFKYQHKAKSRQDNNSVPSESSPSRTPRQHFFDTGIVIQEPTSISPSKSSFTKFRARPRFAFEHSVDDVWRYAIPHWIDVSFWKNRQIKSSMTLTHNNHIQTSRAENFVPRCRMYELQMMALMENEMGNISIPYLYEANYDSKDEATNTSVLNHKRSVLGAQSFSTKVDRQQTRQEKGHQRTSRTEFKWMDQYDEDAFAFKDRQRANLKNKSSSDDIGKDSIENPKLQIPSSLSSSTGTVVGSILHPEIGGRHKNRGSISSQLKPSVDNVKSEAGSLQLDSAKIRAFAPFGMRYQNKASASTASSSAELSAPNFATKTKTSSLSQTGSSPQLVTAKIRESLSRLPSSTQSEKSKSDPILIEKSPSIIAQRNISGRQLEPDSYRLNALNKFEPTDMLMTVSSTRPRQTQLELENAFRLAHPSTSLPDEASPWLTLLNPSNPVKHLDRIPTHYGRWQHIFPNIPNTSTIKWKSLCSPASLPLTIGYFPTKEQLHNDYSESPYKIAVIEDDEGIDAPKSRSSLIHELIGFRLSHGFQVVSSPNADDCSATNISEASKLFKEDFMKEDGATVFLSKGSNIHQLVCAPGGEVQVIRYKRKSTSNQSLSSTTVSIRYVPHIRTLLSVSYKPRQITLVEQEDDYNWSYIDNYIAGHQHNITNMFRFWRARFVFLPIETPRGGRKQLATVNEDSDEEIRIEGLQKLTQLWQKHRHIASSDRRLHTSIAGRQDPNPLEIEYQTQDPSMVVATGLVNSLLIEGETVVPTTHIFKNDSDLYRTANVDLAKLSNDLQSEKGVRVQNRLWHWRIHASSFLGLNLTNWLIANFKDVDNREQAVELGNALMDRGLFQHVSKKHRFRDGNYFYTFANEFQRPKPESRISWFGTTKKNDRPILNASSWEVAREPYSPDRSKGDSTDDSSNASETHKISEKGIKKHMVKLSAVLPYEVDHRKKSSRPQMIDLHYDRLHNPENAYHVQISWSQATSGLIEDAVNTWAITAEKHGLRLVQVPILEAASISNIHPFREPYLIKLALPPPDSKRPQRTYDDGTLTARNPLEDYYAFNKAIMRKFNFVLDVEAASNYPKDVDVSYSWGKPDYQHSQYIHKSGAVIVQIVDRETFILVANRLHNNRLIASRDLNKFDKGDGHDRRPISAMSARQITGSRVSPHASPQLRAVLESQMPAAFMNTTPNTTSATAQSMVDTLSEFCGNVEALKAFYEETTKSQATPIVKPTPMLDATIPKLRLPPHLDLEM